MAQKLVMMVATVTGEDEAALISSVAAVVDDYDMGSLATRTLDLADLDAAGPLDINDLIQTTLRNLVARESRLRRMNDAD